MTVHIHSTSHQPATKYKVVITDTKTLTIHNTPRTRVGTQCCKRIRIAANCTVQVYYDEIWFWCRPGKGCK